jgi:hypothetical protein
LLLCYLENLHKITIKQYIHVPHKRQGKTKYHASTEELEHVLIVK